MRTRYVSIGALACLTQVAPVAADPVADFYKGKQLTFIIRSGVGGGYDQYARLLGRHIGKHIPGNPTFLPVNMPGGGGITAAMHVAMRAPKDGSILTIVSQGLPVDQALGINKSFTADLRQFNWIGNMSDSNQILVAWHTAPVKTLEDAKRIPLIIGATGAGSISTQLPAFYNNVLGTKFRIIFGYPDGSDIMIAMERGEVQGRGTNPWASYLAVYPQLIKEKKVIPLMQVGLRKEADLPDVPLMRDLARNDQERLVLDYMSKATAVGRPIATTPGVPADRVNALRRAFDATLKDPEFKKEAEAQRAEISPMTGEELAKLVDDLINAPQSVLDTVRSAMETPKDAQEIKVPGKKGDGG